MSKQISGKELVDVKISQINFDLHSEDLKEVARPIDKNIQKIFKI